NIGELYPVSLNDYAYSVRLERGKSDRFQSRRARVGRIDRSRADSGGLPNLPRTLLAGLDTGVADAFGRQLEPANRRRFLASKHRRPRAIRIYSHRGFILRGDPPLHP